MIKLQKLEKFPLSSKARQILDRSANSGGIVKRAEFILIVSLLSLVSLVTTALYLIERSRRIELEVRLNASTIGEVRAKSLVLPSAKIESEGDEVSAESGPHMGPKNQDPSTDAEVANALSPSDDAHVGPNDWSASQRLADIEKLVAVPADAREELLGRLRSTPAFTLSNERLASLVSEIVGEDEGHQLREALEVRDTREREADLDVRVAVLQQRLGLEPEQAEKVKDVYRQVVSELAPSQKLLSSKMEEAMAQHFASDAEGNLKRKDLQSSFDTIQKLQDQMKVTEETLLRQRLPTVLSKDQFSTWSSEKAAE